MKRLTRKEIEAGLEAMPIQTILLGATGAKTTKLTHKQRAFAKEVAMGETKAGAYRKAYKSKGKPQTQSIEGQKLMKNPAIALQVEAITLALEANQYITPASLRALAIHKITEKALDPDVPPAQQLKALELLGKITEVALFTERREIVQVTNSQEMKDKLLNSIRLALSSQDATDVDLNDADSLLAEITGSTNVMDDAPDYELEGDDVMDVQEENIEVVASTNENSSDPLHHDPQNSAFASEPDLHSIPDIQSPQNNKGLTDVSLSNPLESDTCVSIGTNPDALEAHLEGVGGINSVQDNGEVLHVTPPVTNSNKKG
jgi:hypothetical protein